MQAPSAAATALEVQQALELALPVALGVLAERHQGGHGMAVAADQGSLSGGRPIQQFWQAAPGRLHPTGFHWCKVCWTLLNSDAPMHVNGQPAARYRHGVTCGLGGTSNL